ncbi:hypothetical protein PDIG_23490 [Penicillium digitatum PHI26]|uniref:Uncharacterized protein n=2 Tax=Penicillium digitatum TaxID=36651 RepID=K9G3R0_PEND2|nr:hypothetical protein PDIP_15900 [Penicillium digitatum Pd1]EKV15994.1 hypothetical protein PDIG_23490 [Penicillium digitatum PHI26]EKV20506.1 hypothetical protein PDIP_15900 [Penicillium digitatum Pd1]
MSLEQFSYLNSGTSSGLQESHSTSHDLLHSWENLNLPADPPAGRHGY